MDELIGVAMEALSAAAKRKRENDPEARERYERMLEALQQRRAAQMPAPPPPAAPAPPVVAPGPVPRAAAPIPPAARAPKQTAHDREEAARAAAARAQGGGIVGLFEDGNSLLRAVVASEVLAPPLALRENPNWLTRRPPNEPST